MAAVDFVLRRSSRIASPKRRHELEQVRDTDNDQLTPRALRALKRQRLTLDSDGLPLPQIETHPRRRKRKENDNITATGPLKEVRRRVRHLRIRTRPQNLSKSRHILSSQQSSILAPNNDPPPQDVPTQFTPPCSPSSIPHHRPPSPLSITQHPSPSPPPLEAPSQPPPPSSSSPNPPIFKPQPSPPLHQIPMRVDLDSLIPLDPLPEFLPHDPPYTDSNSFSSNASFSPVQVHELPSAGDMNFPPTSHPFSPQEPAFSSPGAFGSNHNAFNSNPGNFPNGGFPSHSHEFIPVHSHSHPNFPSSQVDTFSNTTTFPSPVDFPTPSSNGFTSPPSNGFHPQSDDYTQSNGYTPANGYTQQGAFSQSHHTSQTYEYTPVPHREREVNIWKLACQERVEFLLHRYGIDTIKALVASQAHTRYQSSLDTFSGHASSTRFRLYTPASYIERSSYTYKSAEFDGMDFEMDEDADYDDDDDDEDDDECDFGCEYDCNDDDDGDESFHMDVENEKLDDEAVKSPDQEALKRSDSLETKIKTSMPTTPIVPPKVPPIPLTISISSSETSIPQIPLSGSGSPRGGLSGVVCSPRTPSIPHTSSPRPPCTPLPPSTHATSSLPSTHGTPSIPQTPAPPGTPTTPSLQTPPVPVHETSQAPQPPTSTLRTPPLSSLHVTLLSEPPRAFMGRGTPPDRRRLSEWGRWGCVHTQLRAMGLHGDGERTPASMSLPQGDHVSVSHVEHESVLQGEHAPTSPGEHISVSLMEHTSVSHGEAQQQREHGEHLPVQHGELQHNEHEHEHSRPHIPPHEHLPTHGEWTSFLFAMLEGDTTGSSTGWYELGAGVSPSPSISGSGEAGPGSESAVEMGTLGNTLSLPQSMSTLNVSQSISTLSVPQTVGEADSTLRFALG